MSATVAAQLAGPLPVVHKRKRQRGGGGLGAGGRREKEKERATETKIRREGELSYETYPSWPLADSMTYLPRVPLVEVVDSSNLS